MSKGKLCILYVTDEAGQKGYLSFYENDPNGKVTFVPLKPSKPMKPTTKATSKPKSNNHE